MTVAYDRLEKVCAAKTDFLGAQILGFHFEGPFIAEENKGAQNPAYIKDPDLEAMKRFKNIKMISLAPERPGAEQFIREMSKDMIVSIGHSVCDYDTALKAIDWGVNCLTHTYNAMPPFHHRAPGPIGAAKSDHHGYGVHYAREKDFADSKRQSKAFDFGTSILRSYHAANSRIYFATAFGYYGDL